VSSVTREFYTKLWSFDSAFRSRMAAAVATQTDLLYGRALGRLESVLHARSNKTFNSMEKATFTTSRGNPLGKVFSDYYIARFYELGFGGYEGQVRSYPRRVSVVNQTDRVRGAVRAQLKWTKKHGGTVTVPAGMTIVKAYTRKMRWIQLAFLAPALDDQRSQIRAAFEAAAHGGA
jgi:hypothetical protein